MAAKKGRSKEIALQKELETQEEWEEFISKEGLAVVDVYQEWCGPCKAVVSSFKRIKNETGDDLLRFAVAKADTIDQLEKYRGTCEPCFLFYASGSLVEVIRGVEGPKLARSVVEQLAQEHKVLDGTAERKEIFDPKFPPSAKHDVDGEDDEVMEESSSDDDDDDEFEQEPAASEGDMRHGGELVNFMDMPDRQPVARRRRGVYLTKTFSVIIILPDVAADERLPDIISKIESSGFEILENVQRNLTTDEVKEIYAAEAHKEVFDSFAEFMTGEPSVILCVSRGKFGDNVVEDINTMVGPPSVKEAMGAAPESLRAQYGKPENFLSPGFYTSSDAKVASRDIEMFFPDYVGKRTLLEYPVPEKKPKLLAIMTAAAFKQYGTDDLIKKIEAAGYKILHQKPLDLTKARAEQFYKKIKDHPQYSALVNSISSGKVYAVAVTKEGVADPAADWNHLIGPDNIEDINNTPHCLRAQFVVRGDPVPALHASADLNAGQREVAFIFPMQEVLITIKPHAKHHTDEILHRIRREGFIIIEMKEAQLTNPMVADLYRNVVDQPFFEDLTKQMTSGTTTFICALKVDGIQHMRRLVGKVSPEEAVQDDPSTLRAMFGTSIIENAVHVPSTSHTSRANIAKIFGVMDFDHDGVILKRRKPKMQLGQIEDSPTVFPPKDKPDVCEQAVDPTDLPPAEAGEDGDVCPLKTQIAQEEAEAAAAGEAGREGGIPAPNKTEQTPITDTPAAEGEEITEHPKGGAGDSAPAEGQQVSGEPLEEGVEALATEGTEPTSEAGQDQSEVGQGQKEIDQEVSPATPSPAGDAEAAETEAVGTEEGYKAEEAPKAKEETKADESKQEEHEKIGEAAAEAPAAAAVAEPTAAEAVPAAESEEKAADSSQLPAAAAVEEAPAAAESAAAAD